MDSGRFKLEEKSVRIRELNPRKNCINNNAVNAQLAPVRKTKERSGVWNRMVRRHRGHSTC